MKDRNYPFEKVLVIGIDGGTSTVLDLEMGRGSMPFLKSLVEAGANGVLRSTLPPITGPAWRTFASGCNPGKHGVFDFVEMDSKTRRVSVKDVSNSLLPSFWEEASRQKKTVGIMGVPMTYPAKPVDGFLLTGIMTPPNSDSYAYPKKIAEELRTAGLEWPFSSGSSANASNARRYINQVIKDTRSRVATAEYLIDKHDPDLSIFVFDASDPIQHQYFDEIIEPKDSELSDLLTNFYSELDGGIKNLVELFGEDTLVIIMSDHGFGPLKGFIHLNNWLLEKGYLVLRDDFVTRGRYVLHRMGFTAENIYRMTQRLGIDLRRRLNRGRVYSLSKKVFLSFENVDWERTKAFSLGHIGQVYVNRHSTNTKDIQQITNSLLSEIPEMTHPVTGEKLIDRVHVRDEIYSGPHLSDAPDLILEPRQYEYVGFGESEFASNLIVGPALHSGHHRVEGKIIVSGPAVRHSLAGAELDASIEDIMPTVLYSMGLEIPDYIDGKPIIDLFSNQFVKNVKARIYQKPLPTEDSDNGQGYSSDEEDQVRQRLRDLGYIA